MTRADKWSARVEVHLIVGNLEVDLKEVGAGLDGATDGATAQLCVPAP